MDWGWNNRISKLFLPDQHCFYLAMDHGYFQGPTHGLEDVGKVSKMLESYVDAFFVTRGILRNSIDPRTPVAIILRVSGGISIVSKDLSNEEVSTTADEVVRLNASAVGYSVYIGTEYEHQTLMGLFKLVNECTPFGIPVMAVTAVGRELEEKKEARFLGMACRICAESGASVVKTYYCEDFDKIVAGCPVPVVIAGGPKTNSDIEVLKFVYNGMQKGASGVNLGRNIWQNDCPIGMASALRAIIHEKYSPKEAYELFLSIKNEEMPVKSAKR